MKFFRTAASGLVALVILLGIAPAFASEAPGPDITDALETGEVLTDAPDFSAPAGDGDVPGDTSPDSSDNSSGPALSDSLVVTCSGADVTVYLDDRSYAFVVNVDGGSAFSSTFDVGTLPGFLRAMFGEYTPKTQTVATYYGDQLLATSTEIVPGLAGLDVEWLASVALFGMVIYCLFRMLGGMVR